jgi:hypothetical protein
MLKLFKTKLQYEICVYKIYIFYMLLLYTDKKIFLLSTNI